MKEFQERMKELREAKNLTYYAVAKATGFDPKSITRWENGIQIPNIETLVTLANFFGVTTDFLLGRTEY